MEFGNSLSEEKENSPSQKNTAHFQTMKREVESLEDFQEITKDEPSLIDLTAVFLQYEKEGTPEKSFKDELNLRDNECDLKRESKDGLPLHLSHEELLKLPEEYDSQMEPLKEANDTKILGVDLNISSYDLLSFEDSYYQNKLLSNLDQVKEESANVNQSDSKNCNEENSVGSDDPLVEESVNVNQSDSKNCNEENSVGSDDFLVLPERKESSVLMYSDSEKNFPKMPLSECKSNELTESFPIKQSLLKFTSEPGLSTTEKKLEGLQGDGLHVKNNSEADGSDNDDIAPEPIPKDYPEIGVIQGKEFLAAIGLDTWFHPHLLNPKVESLIYWRDPKKSGIVFGSVLVILLSLTTFSLISVIAHTSLLVLVAALAFRIYKSVLQAVQKTSDGHPFKTYLDAVVNHPIITAVFFTIEEYLDVDLTLNPEKAREVSDVVISQVNKALTKCRSLFLVEDVIDSIKFAVLLWCLTYVGAWFNGLSLLIIAFVGLFTLPKVYENNKTQIDANIDVVKSKIKDVSEKIRAVIPLGKKPEEVKDKGE